MKKLTSLLLLLCLILSACSSTQTARSIAQEPVSEEAKAALDALFTIKLSNTVQAEEDIYKMAESNLKALVHNTKIKMELIEDSSLINETAFKIEPIIEKNEYVFRIKYAENAFNDHSATMNLIHFVDNLLSNSFNSTYSAFELYYNVLKNDPTAFHAVAKIRKLSLVPLNEGHANINYSQYNGFLQGETTVWNKKVQEFAKLEKKNNADKKVLAEERKARMAKLDTLPEDKQFRYLVSINDRNGAADLIKSYLPWEEMAPFEKRFWENHLEIMRNPVPLAERVMIYRGIDDDLIQTPVEAGKKLAVEDAIKEQNIFVMSTMMTKNQGSWNRRLRSLSSMYEKFIGTVKDKITNEGTDEFAKAARITTLFYNHSKKPNGSPFLSFTPNFATANTFGRTRVSAYLIDPRALDFNYASNFAHEKEFLAALVTFPDEIIAVYDANLMPPHEGYRDAHIQKLIIQNLENKLGAAEGIETYKRVTNNSKKFFAGMATMNFDEESIVEKTTANAADIAKLKLPAANKQVDNCNDLIKMFMN